MAYVHTFSDLLPTENSGNPYFDRVRGHRSRAQYVVNQGVVDQGCQFLSSALQQIVDDIEGQLADQGRVNEPEHLGDWSPVLQGWLAHLNRCHLQVINDLNDMVTALSEPDRLIVERQQAMTQYVDSLEALIRLRIRVRATAFDPIFDQGRILFERTLNRMLRQHVAVIQKCRQGLKSLKGGGRFKRFNTAEQITGRPESVALSHWLDWQALLEDASVLWRYRLVRILFGNTSSGRTLAYWFNSGHSALQATHAAEY